MFSTLFMSECLLGCLFISLRNGSMEGLNKVLPEGLPLGMVKEFEESMRSAVLVRQSFLDLRDNFRRVVDPSLLSPAGITFLLLSFLFGGGLKQMVLVLFIYTEVTGNLGSNLDA